MMKFSCVNISVGWKRKRGQDIEGGNTAAPILPRPALPQHIKGSVPACHQDVTLQIARQTEQNYMSHTNRAMRWPG